MTSVCLNLGAGKMPIDGYLSLDKHAYLPDTVICDFPPLPYDTGAVDHIYAGHVIEHLPPWDVEDLLRECYRVLRVGGTLTVVIPDAHKAKLSHLSGRIPGPVFAEIVTGADYDDMPHRILWRRAWVAEALERVGFVVNTHYRYQNDERVYDRTAAWQSGVQGVKEAE